MAVDPYAFAPEVEPAVHEINRRFPKLGRGGTYPNHGDDQPGGLEENFYAADFWSTVKADHDEAFAWIIANHERLNLKLVISWCRIWSVERKSEGIRRYFQCEIAGTSPSKRHTNHLHVEFEEQGYYMPSLSDIRQVIREELRANNDNAADLLLDRDGKIVNRDDQGVIFDSGAGSHAALKTAVMSLGQSVRAIKKKLSV